MELRTILLSLMTLIVVGLVIIIIYELTYGGGITTPSRTAPQKTSVQIIGNLHHGDERMKFENDLPKSQNEEDGIEYSYACWLLINNYSDTSDVPIIYVRGRTDLSLQSPSVTLRRDRNEIHILQDTFNSKEPGKIVITNLPAGKLIHIVVSIKQASMDVYIDGLLYKHLTLSSLPFQNNEPMYIAENGGWHGMIGSFVYYNYALSPDEVRKLSQQKPTRDPNDLPPYPPYLDTSWWITKYT